jgi:hypothetical protein
MTNVVAEAVGTVNWLASHIRTLAVRISGR